MKVTIKDVAKEADVATSTVSRVLSNNPRISETTRKRVQEAIDKLGYEPNAMARSLARQRTKILGVVLPNEAKDLFTNPFFITSMQGMSLYAQTKGYYITYAFSEDDKGELNHVKEITNNNLIDGVILMRSRQNDEIINYLQDKKFPFVVIGRPEDTESILWVDNDNVKATYDLVHLLIENGHKKIGFVGAIEKWNMSQDRLKGYKDALIDSKLDYYDNLIVQQNEFNAKNGYDAAKKLFKEEGLTAIVTTDDLLALGVQEYVKDNNMKDIALIGFNNSQIAQYQKPSIASVDIMAGRLGNYAAKLLISKLEGKNSKRKNYIVDTKLVERDTFI